MKRWQKVFFGLLSVALLVSTGLNFFIYRFSKQYYRQLNGVRLDPLGDRFLDYPPKPPAPMAGKTRVVFFGDSRAQQWPDPPELAGYEFINRGIGAQTSTQVMERFDRHVVPLQPDILVLQVGINDLKAIPLFPEQKEKIIAITGENIAAIVQKARQMSTIVILTTIFPEGQIPLIRRPFWSPEVAAGRQAVNAFIESQSGDGVVILDTAPILAGNSERVQPEYSRDFLHLNSTGYAALNAALAPLLESIQIPSH